MYHVGWGIIDPLVFPSSISLFVDFPSICPICQCWRKSHWDICVSSDVCCVMLCSFPLDELEEQIGLWISGRIAYFDRKARTSHGQKARKNPKWGTSDYSKSVLETSRNVKFFKMFGLRPTPPWEPVSYPQCQNRSAAPIYIYTWGLTSLTIPRLLLDDTSCRRTQQHQALVEGTSCP